MTDNHTPILTAIGGRIYGETAKERLIARVYGDDALAAQFAVAPEMLDALSLWAAADQERDEAVRQTARQIAREKRDAVLAKLEK